MYQLFFSSFVDGIFLSFQRTLVFLGFTSIIIKPHSTLPLKYMRTSLISTASSRKCDTSKLCSHEVNLEQGGNFWRQGGVQGFQDNRRQTFKHESHLKCSGFHTFPSFEMKLLDLIKWGGVVVGNRWGVPPPKDGGGGMGIWRDWGAGGALTK